MNFKDDLGKEIIRIKDRSAKAALKFKDAVYDGRHKWRADEVRALADAEVKFRAFLEFKTNDRFSKVFFECFSSWRLFISKREKLEAALKLKDDFYNRDQIFDLISRLRSCICGISDDESAVSVKNCIYRNYIVFLQIKSKRAAEDYEALCSMPDVFSASGNSDITLRFIKNECSTVAGLMDIPEAEEYIRDLKPLVKAGAEADKISEKKYSFVFSTLEILEICMKKKQEALPLKEKAQMYAEKTETSEAEINAVKKMYLTFNDIFKRIDFSKYDPDIQENIINSMTVQELKDFYLESFAALFKIFDDFA